MVWPCPLCIEIQINHSVGIYINAITLRFPTISDSVSIPVLQTQRARKFRCISVRINRCRRDELIRTDRGRNGDGNICLSYSITGDDRTSDPRFPFAKMGGIARVILEEIERVGCVRLTVELAPYAYRSRIDTSRIENREVL